MASPSQTLSHGPTANTTAPLPVSPPWRLASAPLVLDASTVHSLASAHSRELAAVSDASSPLLASKSEEYMLFFRLPPDEVIRLLIASSVRSDRSLRIGILQSGNLGAQVVEQGLMVFDYVHFAFLRHDHFPLTNHVMTKSLFMLVLEHGMIRLWGFGSVYWMSGGVDG
ncbi:hypothetical protein ABZP36_030677 [Zizania latifolia]